MPAEKKCLACNAPLERRSRETSSNYRKRLTCGRHCRALLETAHKLGITHEAAREQHAFKVTCRACGQPITRATGEATTEYRHRKYCSRACAQRDHPGPGIKHGLTRLKRKRALKRPPVLDVPLKDGLTPRQTLAEAARMHPLLLAYIASPPTFPDHWEIHTHIGFGTLEEAA